MKNLVKLLLSAFILAFLGGCSFGGDEESGGTICAFANHSDCFPEFSGGSPNAIEYAIIREPVSENDRNTFLNTILAKGYSLALGSSDDYFRYSFWHGNAMILTAQAGIGSTRIYMSIEYNQGSSSGWRYPDIYNDIFAPLPSSAKLVFTSTTYNFSSDMTSQFNAYSNKLQEHGFSPYTSITWRKKIGGVVYSWTRYTNTMAEWKINAAGAY